MAVVEEGAAPAAAREGAASAAPRETAAPAPGIALSGVTKRFGRTAAVDRVELAIEEGEFFAVLGPSGCGKSTLLRLVAGLEPVDEGAIALAGREVAAPRRHVPPEARGVAVVFQSYALWPHMDVRANVAFPTEAARLPRDEAGRVVERALDAVALTPFADRKPASLSGGQQQRVALARCLASRARTVLMDEPLANLDPHLRAAMEEELCTVHAASGATTLYITHDQREAMALADRIAVMRAGSLIQVDAPDALYERPANAHVARFIGRASLVEVEVREVRGSEARVRLTDHEFTARCSAGQKAGAATLVVRPSDVRLGEGLFAGKVGGSTYRGGVWEVSVALPNGATLGAESRTPVPEGAVSLAVDGGWVLPE